MSNTSLEKSKIRILLLEGVHQSAIDTLNAAGYTNIEYLTHSLGEEDLIEKIADAHFVGIRSRTQLTEKVFEAAKKLVAVRSEEHTSELQSRPHLVCRLLL